MNEDLHGHLDVDVPLDDLAPHARSEAQAWDRLLAAFQRELPRGGAPPWLESRIMAEVEALPEPGLLRRGMAWLLNPRPVRVSPLTAGLAVAALATVFFLGIRASGPNPTGVLRPAGPDNVMTAGNDAGAEIPVVYVQFVLEAPSARTVSVAGDFNDWEEGLSLQDLDGDGVWTGRVPVRPGVHAYMFLVDDTTWMTDPRAERYAEDGFGNRNAILAVATPST